MRGTDYEVYDIELGVRITPAHAGNSIQYCIQPILTAGSPPHMRGTASNKSSHKVFIGITPAHAGNSFSASFSDSNRQDHPRTCGEQPKYHMSICAFTGSPPHMRGTVSGLASTGVNQRITPAHAGNSRISRQYVSQFRDHPRTCGEQTGLYS